MAVVLNWPDGVVAAYEQVREERLAHISRSGVQLIQQTDLIIFVP